MELAKTTGGGLVRDSDGNMVVAFPFKFNHHGVLQAELDALIQGWLCAYRNTFQVMVEIDFSRWC